MNLESKCVEKYAGNDIELLDTHGVLQLGPFPFLFDIEDLPIIKSHIWYRDKDGYLVSCYYYNSQQNRADNRKQNLRCCNRSENMRNRGLCSSNTSGVTGVFFDKERQKWVASITYNHKRMLLGRFASKEDAVSARLTKEAELFKEFAPQRT